MAEREDPPRCTCCGEWGSHHGKPPHPATHWLDTAGQRIYYCEEVFAHPTTMYPHQGLVPGGRCGNRDWRHHFNVA